MRVIPSFLCTEWWGSPWNIDTCLFFLLIDSCFLHNFSKEYRLPFREEGAFLAPKQESERWRKGWIFDSSTGNDSSYVLIPKIPNKQARETTKNKQNKTTTKQQRTSRHYPFSVCLFCHLAVLMFQHVASWIVAILPELAGFRHHWLQKVRQNELEVWQWVYIKFGSWQYCLSWLDFLHFRKLYLSSCAWAFSPLASLQSVQCCWVLMLMHGPMLALLHIMFWPPGCKELFC